MTGLISPARRFNQCGVRFRASWRVPSPASPRTQAEQFSPGGRIVESTRSVRLRQSRCQHGEPQGSNYSGRSMRAYRSTLAQLMWKSATSRSTHGSTQSGGNIAIGSHQRLSARFSAATPGCGERSWMLKPCKAVRSGSWGRTTSRHSREAVRAFPGRSELQRPGGPRGRSFAASVVRSNSESVQAASSSQKSLRFESRRTDFCHTWSATLLEHYSRSARVGEHRNGPRNCWPSETAGLDRLWPRLTDLPLRESVSPVTY